jgi:hypothetical protein
MEAMSGEESFRGWLAQYAQHFLDATNWQEFHGIADAYSVRLQIRANGFVFVDKESGVAAKASDVHRRLAKPAFEARLGKFVDAETVKARAAQRAYRKKPRVNTEELWREYTAQRDARWAASAHHTHDFEMIGDPPSTTIAAVAQAAGHAMKSDHHAEFCPSLR